MCINSTNVLLNISMAYIQSDTHLTKKKKIWELMTIKTRANHGSGP